MSRAHSYGPFLQAQEGKQSSLPPGGAAAGMGLMSLLACFRPEAAGQADAEVQASQASSISALPSRMATQTRSARLGPMQGGISPRTTPPCSPGGHFNLQQQLLELQKSVTSQVPEKRDQTRHCSAGSTLCSSARPSLDSEAVRGRLPSWDPPSQANAEARLEALVEASWTADATCGAAWRTIEEDAIDRQLMDVPLEDAAEALAAWAAGATGDGLASQALVESVMAATQQLHKQVSATGMWVACAGFARQASARQCPAGKAGPRISTPQFIKQQPHTAMQTCNLLQ